MAIVLILAILQFDHYNGRQPELDKLDILVSSNEDSLRERNAKRHRAATVSLTLDDWEHAKEEPSERALDLDLLCRTVELEVLYQFRNEGLHLYHPDESGVRRRHERPSQWGEDGG